MPPEPTTAQRWRVARANKAHQESDLGLQHPDPPRPVDDPDTFGGL